MAAAVQCEEPTELTQVVGGDGDNYFTNLGFNDDDDIGDTDDAFANSVAPPESHLSFLSSDTSSHDSRLSPANQDSDMHGGKAEEEMDVSISDPQAAADSPLTLVPAPEDQTSGSVFSQNRYNHLIEDTGPVRQTFSNSARATTVNKTLGDTELLKFQSGQKRPFKDDANRTYSDTDGFSRLAQPQSHMVVHVEQVIVAQPSPTRQKVAGKSRPTFYLGDQWRKLSFRLSFRKKHKNKSKQPGAPNQTSDATTSSSSISSSPSPTPSPISTTTTISPSTSPTGSQTHQSIRDGFSSVPVRRPRTNVSTTFSRSLSLIVSQRNSRHKPEEESVIRKPLHELRFSDSDEMKIRDYGALQGGKTLSEAPEILESVKEDEEGEEDVFTLPAETASSLQSLLAELLTRGKVRRVAFLSRHSDSPLAFLPVSWKLSPSLTSALVKAVTDTGQTWVRLTLEGNIFVCLKHGPHTVVGHSDHSVMVISLTRGGRVVVALSSDKTPGSCLNEVSELVDVLNDKGW